MQKFSQFHENCSCDIKIMNKFKSHTMTRISGSQCSCSFIVPPLVKLGDETVVDVLETVDQVKVDTL